jgi:hypothetical protein
LPSSSRSSKSWPSCLTRRRDWLPALIGA